MRPLCFGLLALALGACAHSTPFTTPAELKALAQRPRPAKAFASTAIDVKAHALAGPFAEGIEGHETASPWAGLLIAEAKGRYTVDGPLGCAAREIARFAAEHEGLPSRPIEGFILGRCGSSAPFVRVSTVSGKVDASIAEADLFAQWQADARAGIAHVEPGEEAGIALARDAGRAWLVLLRHRPGAKLVPAVRTVDAEGRLVIEGRLTGPGNKIEALINHGTKDWSVCLLDAGRALPDFRLVCRARPDDVHAWLSIAAWEPNRILGKEVARVLVWPKGVRTDAYAASTDVPSGPATVDAFLERLNAVRAKDTLAPLTLAARQSDTASSVAPQFFGSADGQSADQIALGLMAGWDVEGLVTSGSFDADWTPQPDAGALLLTMLESPSGRRSLLSKQASQIAVGLVTEGNAMGVLISTYTFASPVDPVGAQQLLLGRLNDARAKAGKGPAQWVTNPPEFYVRSAKALLANETTPSDVAGDFMDETLRLTRRPVRGLTQIVTDLSDVKWADEVLNHPSPQVLFFVGIQRATGDAWGGYVVIVLLLEGAAGGPQARSFSGPARFSRA